jgi:hypothetical protein
MDEEMNNSESSGQPENVEAQEMTPEPMQPEAAPQPEPAPQESAPEQTPEQPEEKTEAPEESSQ